ncbi:uncharacterized protein LOC142026061 isoform X5 [Buteo buteo]|uniref:uncharacterized protein LOC142026061 isoform X5 n=1 Tax=Buteo buteo TaxID=30397 RepID=UPI003EBFF8E3
MLIIMEVKVDLETTHCHVRRSSSRRSRCSQRTSSTLDVHHHGGQGAPGEPPPCWTFIVTESGCSRRMSPRWMFLVTEIKVLQENLLRVGRSLSRSQGAPGEPHHVGRSSSRTSRCSRRTSATLDVHRHGLQGALGEPPPCWTFIVTESGCSGRTSPRWTFIVTDFKVLRENLTTSDVHHHGLQGAPGEPPPCWTFIVMEVRVLQENFATSDVHCHGVRVLQENVTTLDVPRHGNQGAPGEPPPCWTFIVTESGCSGTTSPRRTFIVTDFKVLQENLRHVGRSSSRTSRCSRRTSATLDVHRHGVRVLQENLATSDVHRHGNQGAPGEPPPCWTFIVMEVKVLQENLATSDVHRHGLQGAPGEPPPRRTFIVTESGCSRRTSPCWTFLVTEIKVLQENLLHVGRSSSRRSGCSWTLGSLTWTLGCPPHPPGTLGFLTSPHPVWLR